MALATVAIHVDDDIAAEFLAKFEGEKRGPVKLHRLLAVDVEDRCLDHFCDVSRVGGRAGILRHGGEADLIVDDEMDGAARAIAFELGEIEHLRDRALAGKCGVAVKQNRQNLATVNFAAAAFAEDSLTSAGLALDERIDGLQVTRICREADPDFTV